jgi:hypothetical protein
MFHQVFSPKLDLSTSWYALNTSNCTINPRQFSLAVFFKAFSEEIKRIKLSDLHTQDGGPVPSCCFFTNNAAKVRVEEVYVATSFVIVGGLCNRKQVSEVKAVISLKIQKQSEQLSYKISARICEERRTLTKKQPWNPAKVK